MSSAGAVAGFASDRKIDPFRIESILRCVVIDLHSGDMAIEAFFVECAAEVCPIERMIGIEAALFYRGEIDPFPACDVIVDRKDLNSSVRHGGQIVLHMFCAERIGDRMAYESSR